MGAYLSVPATEKELFEGTGADVKFGGGAMQGWRRTMEDAHLAVPSLESQENISLFGVFDGHGGAEVAKFCQKYMVAELQKLGKAEPEGIEAALVQVFHRMDEMLRDQKYAEELETLKTKEPGEEEDTKAEENDGISPKDALDMLKRMFQLERFMGGNSGGAAGAAAGGGEGPGGGAGGTGSGPAEAATAVTETPDDVASRVQAGCTAVVAIKRNNELYVANAGDSRGVLCRGGTAVALSEDHKPASETERNRIIAAGGFLSEIGGVCRVNGNLNLSRAIGDLKYKNNLGLAPKDQIITAQPDVRRFAITPEDRFFLLACDGVWDVMTNQDAVSFISQQLDQGMTPTQASAALLDACLASDPKLTRGIGCDNMTVIVVQLKHSGGGGGGAETRASSAQDQQQQQPGEQQQAAPTTAS